MADDTPLLLPDEFTARGRVFMARELRKVIDIANKYSKDGLTILSRLVCESLGWHQENGKLKDVACRDVLRRLEKAGVIQLPAPKARNPATCNSTPVQKDHEFQNITSVDFSQIKFERVSDKQSKRLWNDLIRSYHYLHSSKIVGRQLKYIVTVLGNPIACFGWGDAAWMLGPREQWVHWNREQLTQNRHLVINNVRFLILPWVRIPNLASHLLSRCASVVTADWSDVYGFRPVLFETFVDPNRFSGTCYRAANWIQIGLTAGYAKVGSFHHNSQKPKSIFVLPVCSNFRDILRGK